MVDGLTIERVYQAVAASLHDEARKYLNGAGEWADGDPMTFAERMAAAYALDHAAGLFITESTEQESTGGG